MERRTLAAFALAPLAPVLIDWALAPSPDLDSLIATILVGAFAVTYPLTIGVGLPAYVLITKFGTLRCWHVLAISMATGTLACVLFRLGPPLPSAALGGTAGLTFWSIWYRQPFAPPRT